MFLNNERGLGVKNGSLGHVEAVSPERMAVRLDDGRQVAFDLKDYAEVDYGYAATIHKAQGVTVDRAHVLASSGLDRHAAYVALTRHRDGVELHYGADQIADRATLAKTLGRERAKDTTLDYLDRGEPAQGFREGRGADYARVFAERRDIFVPEQLVRDVRERVQALGQAVSGWVAERAEVVGEQAAEAYRTMKARQRQEVVQAPAFETKPSPFAGLKLKRAPAELETAPKRSPFDGLKLKAGPVAEPAEDALGRDLDAALKRYGRHCVEQARMTMKGFDLLPHQATEGRIARQELDRLRPGGASDLDQAIRYDPRVLRAAREGRGDVLKTAIDWEQELRTSPKMRAERFVEHWLTLKAQHRQLGPGAETAGVRKALEARMGEVASGLKRDPQLESLVKTRAKALGVSSQPQDLGQALVDSLRPGRSRGLSR